MSLPLSCIMVLTWLVVIRRYGAISFACAGVFCFTAYSIPALVGQVFPFNWAAVYLAPSSSAAVHVTILAWVVFLLTMLVPGKAGQAARPAASASQDPHLASFIRAALFVCVAGFMAIAYADGPLFFLEGRDEQSQGTLRLLWRWVNAIGLVASVASRSWRSATVFFGGLVIYFLAGDRTVIAITAFCVLIVWGHGRALRIMCRPGPVLACVFFVVAIIFGKPIYLAAKLGSMDIVARAFTAEAMEGLITTYEPFLTFNILDLVVRHDFTMQLGTLTKGVLGQFLVVPSAFGIDSNSFNTEFTAKYAPRLNFGIAGNYWAHAWAVAGPFGVGVYAVLYAVGLRVLEASCWRYSGVARVLFALLAGLLAVYVHRNSLDNLLSFARQILMVTAAIALLGHVIGRFMVPQFVPRRARPMVNDSRSLHTIGNLTVQR
jgi:hypothetical protein